MNSTIRIIFIFSVFVLLFSNDTIAQLLSGNDAQIRLTEEGKIYVGEAYTGLSKMITQLKKDGIRPKEQITVEIPENTSPNAISAIGRELASNGFRRFVFSKPRKTVVEKGMDPLLKKRL